MILQGLAAQRLPIDTNGNAIRADRAA